MKIKMLILLGILFSSNLMAVTIKKIVVEEKLDKVQLSDKTLLFDVGIGSGAFHFKSDPKNVFYTITDRGPNIKCKESKKIMGKKVCSKGKIFPIPNFTPTIYKFEVSNNSYKILKKIPIKDKNGIKISGIPNANTERAYNIHGKKLPYDPNGLDSEALVKLSNGTFWIGEEYGPSLVNITSNGKILKRVIPQGFKTNLVGANYKISSSLPEIIGKRALNRGIESIAISPNEKFLYFIIQSPLANPNNKAYKKSRNVRLFKYDIESNRVKGEYIYKLDLPKSFKLDNEKKQNAVKISEMVSTGDDELLILERASKTTKFYKVTLNTNNILGSKWDNITTSPSLEESKNIKGLNKTLVLDTSNIKGMPEKIEGIAYINNKNWILTNDNDFGIKGDKSYIIKVKF